MTKDFFHFWLICWFVVRTVKSLKSPPWVSISSCLMVNDLSQTESIFLAFRGFIDSTVEEVTGNGVRERGSDTQQRDPGWETNPGPLQRGQASAHGTPALPTELNGAQVVAWLIVKRNYYYHNWTSLKMNNTAEYCNFKLFGKWYLVNIMAHQHCQEGILKKYEISGIHRKRAGKRPRQEVKSISWHTRYNLQKNPQKWETNGKIF